MGSAVVQGHRIWVGFSFYDGEGTAGIGGIGFYDVATGEVGVHRPPELAYVSADAIEVEEDTLVVATARHEEYGGGPAGRVRVPVVELDEAMIARAKREHEERKDRLARATVVHESLLVVRPGDRELPSRLHPRIGRLRVRLAAVTFDRATERDLPKLSPDLRSHRLELAAADPWGGGDAPWVLAFLTPREAPIGAHWSSDHCGIRIEVELLRAERTGDQYVEAILQVRALREATD